MANRARSTRDHGGTRQRVHGVRLVVLGAVVALVAALVPALALQPGVAGANPPAPAVTTYSPQSGPAVGGNLVTIHGSGFTGVSTVLFGSQSATDVTVVNDAVLEARAPGGLDGPVNVTLYSPSGVSAPVTYFYGPVSTFNVTHTISPSSTAVSPYDIISGPNGDLWFAYSNGSTQSSIGELTPTGGLTVYTDPSINQPRGLTMGPNGSNDVWFTNFGNNSIGRINGTSGVVSNFTGGGINHPEDITLGLDNALWFTNYGPLGQTLGSIGRITTAGVVTNYSGTGISNPWQITAGPTGNADLWFTNLGNNSIGRIQTDGTVTNFADPTMNRPWGIAAVGGSGTGNGEVAFTNAGDGSLGAVYEGFNHAVTNFSDPSIHATFELTVGPDNALWFPNGIQSLGRVAFDPFNLFGAVTTYSSPLISGSVQGGPYGITVGPDNALWFSEPYDGLVGRFASSDVDVRPTVTAVSPASGVAAGGATVTVTGTGFVSGYTTVSFGATAATGVVVTSPSTLTATAPAGSGTVDVTVTTAGGTSAVSAADQFAYGFAITTPPGSLGTAVIGTPFAAPALTADGGVAPYKFKVTSGALPKGLKLNAKTGVVAGTVRASKRAPTPGVYSFTVTATDSTRKTKQTTSAAFTVTLSA